MRYRNTCKLIRNTTHRYNFEHQNESRADLAETALIVATDRSAEDTDGHDVATDVSDLLANVAHFCDRAGLDFGEMVDHAVHAYIGDAKDGPPTQRDADRFPSA